MKFHRARCEENKYIYEKLEFETRRQAILRKFVNKKKARLRDVI